MAMINILRANEIVQRGSGTLIERLKRAGVELNNQGHAFDTLSYDELMTFNRLRDELRSPENYPDPQALARVLESLASCDRVTR